MSRASSSWLRIMALACFAFAAETRPSIGAPLNLLLTFNSHSGSVEWSDAGFTSTSWLNGSNWFQGCACDTTLLTSGFAEITAGPLLSATEIVSGPDQVTRYEFGPGEARIEVQWLDEGAPQTGGFVAPIPSISFDLLVYEAHAGIWRSDTWSRFDLPVGPGLFDESLARFLGVDRQTLGGGFSLNADSTTPGDPRLFEPRFLFFNEAQLRIEAVPEPASLALLMLGTVTAVCRRRLRRSAH